MILPYEEFRETVVKKYASEMSGLMPENEIRGDFDLAVGRCGYREILAEEESRRNLGQNFDPVTEACKRLDRI